MKVVTPIATFETEFANAGAVRNMGTRKEWGADESGGGQSGRERFVGHDCDSAV